MSEARDTGCTFKGYRIFLEYAGEKAVRAFRRFSRDLVESRFLIEDLKPEEYKPVADLVPLGHSVKSHNLKEDERCLDI